MPTTTPPPPLSPPSSFWSRRRATASRGVRLVVLSTVTGAGLLLAGCAAGPDYVKPLIVPPAAFKEAGPWTAARPQDPDPSRPWWTRYGDAELDALVERLNSASLDLQVAEAQFRQAQAAADLARASLFPVVGVSASAGRGRSQASAGTYRLGDSHSLSLNASWEADLWGRIGRGIEAGQAAAQASAADLAAARLSLQATLVQNYLQLRVVDAQKDLLGRTAQDYERALALTRSQWRAGVVTRGDVALAETQLQSTRAQWVDLDLQRRQLEHAIATLTGRAPSALSIAPRADGALGVTLPDTPPLLPSQLLERRPDIAAAERRAAAANAQIGIAQAAYFPSLGLSAGGGNAGIGLGPWLATPERVWSLGATLAATLFDGGARRARTAQATAAYDAAAGQYKRTVLAGFQDVEDQLAGLQVLAQEREVQDAAVASAGVANRSSLAQYRAGTTTFLSVLTSQTLLLNNQRTALGLLGRQLVTSAALVKALGGGWDASQLQAAASAGAVAGTPAPAPAPEQRTAQADRP